MKRIFTLLTFVMAATMAFAQQVPNAGFEEWSDTHTAVGWNSAFQRDFSFTYDGMGFPIPIDVSINYNAATRFSDSHSGEYSAQITTQHATVTMFGDVNLPGMIQLGEFDLDALANLDFNNLENLNLSALDLIQYVYGGVPVNFVPEQCSAWIAYTSTEDTLRAGVLLTRWNNGQRELVAKGEFLQGDNIDDFTQITFPIEVQEGMEGVVPDTMNIIFSTASGQSNENTQLFVDDVTVGSGNAIFEISGLPIFSVRPNPATDIITLTPAADGSYAARLFDNNGRLVWSADNLEGAHDINVSEQAAGIYLLQVKQGDNVKSQKVIVR